MEDFNFDFKIIFWIIAIGIYVFTQIKEVIKKAQKSTAPQVPQIPQPVKKNVKIPGSKPAHRPQSKAYKQAELNRRTIEDDLLDAEKTRRTAFYKETHTTPKRTDYDDAVRDDKGIANEYAKEPSSLFGVDEHLEPYTLKTKKKHPLLTFLSDKNNLRNAFISSEVFNRKY